MVAQVIEDSNTVYRKDLCEHEGCNNQVGAGQGLVLCGHRGLRLRFCSYRHAASWCSRMADIIDHGKAGKAQR
jgi:hypothetical protein